MSYTVYYDAHCPFCEACMNWMRARATIVPLHYCHSQEARALVLACPWLGEELVVDNGRGQLWVGPAAFVVAFWCLQGFRGLIDFLCLPLLLPLTLCVFAQVSNHRAGLGRLFGLPVCHDHCAAPAAAPYR